MWLALLLWAQAPVCGVHCGTERWAVKTVADSGWTVLQATWRAPVATTVTALRALHAPPKDSLLPAGRYGIVERTVYSVRAVVIGWKVESDSDFHIVIADPATPKTTMIVEVPNPHCAQMCSSPAIAAVTAARAAVVAALGKPSTRFRKLTIRRRATIIGVGFLDFLHGQTGVAPNGVELHPVLAVSFR
jgi:hypothetical protein